MPLTQPKRDNPLMRRYFQEINMPGARLARRCGVSHSQIYMARTRNVGSDNAEKISRGIANILGLSADERLRLKAEIMGHPDNLVRAYLGEGLEAAEKLSEELPIAWAIVNPEKTLAHRAGLRVVKRLEEMDAPEVVIEAVRKKVRPPHRPPGRVTNTQKGLEARNRRAESLFLFRLFKPGTAEALERCGLQKQEIRSRVGVGKEQFRKALYERCGRKTADRIAHVLGEELGLSENEREAISRELQTAPPKTFEEAAEYRLCPALKKFSKKSRKSD
jgi:hypothetical protein